MQCITDSIFKKAHPGAFRTRRVRFCTDCIELAQQRQRVGLRIAGPDGVFSLQRGDRVHDVSATDCGGARLGQAETVSSMGVSGRPGAGSTGRCGRCRAASATPQLRGGCSRDCCRGRRGAPGVRDDAELCRQYDLVAAATDYRH
jgi:hypothetical protein